MKKPPALHRWFAALCFCFVSACAQYQTGTSPTAITIDFPAMRAFTPASPGPVTRPNAQIAADFLDLAFEMESGRPLPILTRFEGPITVRLAGTTNPALLRDLEGLLARLRREARIDIRMTRGTSANIVIQTVPNSVIQQTAPNAACFVVPRVQSWSELRAARGSGQLDWATLTERDKAAIFIPSDASPQETRDCLHEELAQALGPLNDLYRLPDSIFNDDNIHAVLTGFDMLILRAYYAPELRNGMSRDAVARRLPAVLARLNPRGQRPTNDFPRRTPLAWKAAMETALTDGNSQSRRRMAAGRAIDIGQAQRLTGTRAGFAQYAYGRLQLRNNPSAALEAFNAANRIFRQSPETELHTAYIAVQLAAFTLLSGDGELTVTITRRAIPIAQRYENAALLSLLMMFEAEGLDLQGQTDAGMAVRLDSLGWALYGFGSRDEVIDRLNEIASLAPRTPPS
ncbi:MAG: DUF2927 domain-containing protein [Yoonia sp.]|uniref:DUF2927 domain-containing protein n=1 Tax=Yoonia sp. TaxID=2212373 RepID=UPI003EF69943